MKIAIVVIIALVCHMAIANKFCDSTAKAWDGTKCVDCPANCTECVWKGGKASCINCGTANGHYLTADGTCGSCATNCSICRGPAVGECQTPIAEHKVNSGAIVKCAVAGCLNCKEEGKCAKCQFGYRLDNGTCTACTDSNCADCSDAISTCKKCGYWNALTNNACTACTNCKDCPCKSCREGFHYDNATCTACTVDKCIDCTANKTGCAKCKSSYYLNVTCIKCGTGCSECTGADQCSKCSSGFGLKDGKTCTPCGNGCTECNGAGECSKCDFLHYLKDKKCEVCPDGCNECNTDGTCKACKAGYFKKDDNKGCEKCTQTAGCVECSDKETCKTCGSGFNPDGKKGCYSIVSCGKGKQLDGNSTCTDGTIDNCWYGNNLTASCYQCATGYVAKDKACVPCPSGCESCSTDPKGHVRCDQLAQQGYSYTYSENKDDTTGYLGKDITFTVSPNNTDTSCMPNVILADYTESLNHKCVAYDNCKNPYKKAPEWGCIIEGNAVKMTLSLFAVVVATLFTL